MLGALLALTLAATDRDIEGLILDAPVELKPVKTPQEGQRGYVGQVTSTNFTGASGVTQYISVVVTDLDKLAIKLTPEQVLRLHERNARTRKEMVGQLMKTQDTTLDGRPLTVIIGSAIAPGNGATRVNAYHISAATTIGDKAYEVTWLTYNQGKEFTDAVRAVRNLRVKKDDKLTAPALLVGTAGDYSLLGVPFSWRLPTAATAVVSPRVTSKQAGRYQGTLSVEGGYVRIDIIQLKDAPAEMTPQEMVAELGHTKLPETNPPKPEEIDGVHVFKDAATGPAEFGRIEVARKDNYVVALTVVGPKKEALPGRDVVSLKPLTP